MADVAASGVKAPPTRELMAAQRRGWLRYFFVGLGIYYIIVAITGFTPSYLAFVSGEFPIPPLVHVHGMMMAAWLSTFVLQSWLAASGKVARHRALGLFATGLAALVWTSMWVMTWLGLHSEAPPQDSFLYDVLLAQLATLVLFAIFFVAAFAARRQSDVHKRLIVLATLNLLQAAIDRMAFLPATGLPGFWDHTFWLGALLFSPLVVFDVLTIRRVHPVTLIGAGVILVVHFVAALLWTNPAWHAWIFSATAFVR